MTKHYLPPTVEDEDPDCTDDGANLEYVRPCDMSRTPSSSSTASSTAGRSQPAESDAGDKRQHGERNDIEVESWNKILWLHEEYRRHQAAKYQRNSQTMTPTERANKGEYT
jgi:hypothetical protein